MVIGILLFVGLVVVGVVLLCKFKLWPKWKKRNVEEESKFMTTIPFCLLLDILKYLPVIEQE